MSRYRSIWLVARREILERVRNRGFIVSVVVTSLLVVGPILLPEMLAGGASETKLGVVQPAPATLDATITAIAKGADATIVVVPIPDRTTAEAALTSGEIAALVDVPADLSGPGELVFEESSDPLVQSVVGSAVAGLRSQAILAESGVDGAAVAASPTIVELHPRSEIERARFLVATLGAVLILVAIFTFGYAVLTGVVEEKQSRVVEVVLSTVRAKDLLMGKILGLGLLGIGQLVVFVGAMLAAATLSDRIQLPSTTPSAIGLLAVWFILGFALYTTALGFLGALASRMEEASNAATPVMIVAIVSLTVSVSAVLNEPSGTIATILTFLPPTAPFVVPMRAAFGAISPWEIVLATVITLTAIWALFTIGARVYSGAVLQTVGRMRLRDAWRSADE
jgi:ABC-2 type transport system permease protein